VSDVEFVKGHGTQNDFIVLLDSAANAELTESQVRALCDRRRGLGADGVLRAVQQAPLDGAPGTDGAPGAVAWFMDYRNADGSVAEMCGNGARVFALALREAGLVASDSFVIATRGGSRSVRIDERFAAGATVTVEMGAPLARTTGEKSVTVTTTDGESEKSAWPAVPVWVPNPHAVVVVDDLLQAGRLLSAPSVAPGEVFPDGVNVEFVVDRGLDPVAGDGTLRVGMRVHERGVGETRSCGTGAVAAAWVWRRRVAGAGDVSGAASSVRVDVPGGSVYVTERSDGALELRGPAVIVARGTIDEAWWKESG
jgi:diaminopimelate epimerase